METDTENGSKEIVLAGVQLPYYGLADLGLEGSGREDIYLSQFRKYYTSYPHNPSKYTNQIVTDIFESFVTAILLGSDYKNFIKGRKGNKITQVISYADTGKNKIPVLYVNDYKSGEEISGLITDSFGKYEDMIKSLFRKLKGNLPRTASEAIGVEEGLKDTLSNMIDPASEGLRKHMGIFLDGRISNKKSIYN